MNAALSRITPQRVLAVFRSQRKDTAEIARAFCLTEAEAYNILARARDAERAPRPASQGPRLLAEQRGLA